MFPNVEVRHLHAVIALGEELHFTKAALRWNLAQSALSRQITEVEKQLRFQLFTRDNRRVVRVELTDAGRVFVEEARSSISHMDQQKGDEAPKNTASPATLSPFHEELLSLANFAESIAKRSV